MSQRFMRAGFVVVVALFVAVTYGAVVSADDHNWANYHWARSSNQVTVELGDNVDSRWDGWLDEASRDWSVSSVLNSPKKNGRAKGNCRPPDGRVEVCNANYGSTGWLGIAQIWVSGDHIVKGAAKMNDSYHDSPPYNSDEWRDMVMCQEVGHTFGLGHQDEVFDNTNLGTCMDYTDDPGGSPPNLSPNLADYTMLETIYDHLDGGGSGGSNCKGPAWKCAGAQTPPPAFDMELTDIGQWGRLVGTSHDGGQSVFVQDFGNGYRVLTHVTWTLEVAEQVRGRR